MDIKLFTVGPFSENTYLLSQNSKALLIDPGFFDDNEYRTCREYLNQNEISLVAVCLTHAHVDHITGLHYILKDFDVPVYLSHHDLYLWKNFAQQAAMFGIQSDGFDFIPKPLKEGKNITIDDFSFDVLYTPGHSPDHISMYIENQQLLIAGDVLFKESVGRTDLYRGNQEILKRSVIEMLYTLPDTTRVLSGHGPETTIGHEKRNNPFVRM